MAKPSIGVVQTRLSRTKRKHDNNDAPTVESSIFVDPLASSTNNTPPRSPLKEQEINVMDNYSSREVSPLKEDGSSSSSSECSSDTIEQQREEGQQQLRELVIGGAESGVIDWKRIISLAEDLHRKEQKMLRSFQSSRGAVVSGDYASIGRRNISRKQAFFERRSKQKEHARRKRLESVGSFSVNLLLYGTDECSNYRGENNPSVVSDSDHNDDEDTNPIEIDIYEDEENESVVSSHSNRPLPTNLLASESNIQPIKSQPTDESTNIVQGSFLAATSLYSLPQFEEENDSSECSNNSVSSDSTVSFSGIEMEKTQSSWDDDDGLITIHEDASVNLW